MVEQGSITVLERTAGSSRNGTARDRTLEAFGTSLRHIENGYTITEACRLAGLGRATFYEIAGANLDKADALKKAQALRTGCLAEEAIAAIRKSFGQDWKAAAWWLERNFPEHFSLLPTIRSMAKQQEYAKSQANARSPDEILRNPEARPALRAMLERANRLAAEDGEE